MSSISPLSSGALVCVSGLDPTGAKSAHASVYSTFNGNVTFTASGIVVGSLGHAQHHQFILCCASVFSPFLTDGNTVSQFTKIKVAVENTVHFPASHGEVDPVDNQRWFRAALVNITNLPGVHAAGELLLNGLASRGWTFGWGQTDKATSRVASYASPGYVALLRVETNDDAVRELATSTLPSTSSSAVPWSLNTPQRGDKVQIVSSPYGLLSRSAFMNSVSSGIISNIILSDTKAALILTDTRCLPGSQGGAVFNNDKQLIGMVTLPFRPPTANLANELNVIIPASHLVPYLRNAISAYLPQPRSIRMKRKEPLSHVKDEVKNIVAERLSHVVLVKMGSAWATGLLMTVSGLVLTNAHLLSAGMTTRHATTVWVRLSRNNGSLGSGEETQWCRGHVVFISAGPWDVALVQVLQDELKEKKVILSPNAALGPILQTQTNVMSQAGTSVRILGHGLFAPPANLQTTVTSGVLSKIVTRSDVQCSAILSPGHIMYQTDAAVHQGDSGGLLIGMKGECLGLVTINSRQAVKLNSKTVPRIMPRMNFSIPFTQLHPLIRYCVAPSQRLYDVMDEHFAQDNDMLRTMWCLDPVLPSDGLDHEHDQAPLPTKLVELATEMRSKM